MLLLEYSSFLGLAANGQALAGLAGEVCKHTVTVRWQRAVYPPFFLSVLFWALPTLSPGEHILLYFGKSPPQAKFIHENSCLETRNESDTVTERVRSESQASKEIKR